MPAMRSALSDATFSTVGRLAEYAADHGRTLLDLALAWLAAFPAVASVIAGATRPEQVLANATAIGWGLTPGQRDEVTRLAAGP
jgi:aryl-alcohol dehydrogenase-like predicted oxidoreductase